MKYVSIFPSGKEELGTKIMLGSASIKADDYEAALVIAAKTVPEGWPFFLVTSDEYDTTFHTAYDPDWSNPDGYGNDSKMLLAMEMAGHKKNW